MGNKITVALTVMDNKIRDSILKEFGKVVQIGIVLIICSAVAVGQDRMATVEKSSMVYNGIPITQDAAKSAVLNKIISITVQDAPLLEAVKKIAVKANLEMVYNSKLLAEKNRSITINLKQVTVERAIWAVLEETGLRFAVSADKQLVLLKRKEAKNSLQWIPAAIQETITGTVTNGQTGETLPGVNILVKGTSTGASTDANGAFELTVESLQDTLVVTYIGYQRQEVPINGRTDINIVMQPQAISGEEMVVVGFAEQKKANITGSVSTVDSKSLESRSVTDTGQMLQGMVPGLNFQTSGRGGELNQDLSFNIRGTGTIGTGSNASPLVLIDGVEADLNSVNPNDIESITVLKDAAAASIYGSRAAFGVILLTTKSGQTGEPRFSYRSNLRFSSPIGIPDMMDSYTFANYWNESALNDGQEAIYTNEVIERIVQYQNGEIDYETLPDPNSPYYLEDERANANTDWFDVHYKDYAMAQDHNLSVSGGTDAVTYYVSGNFLDQSGLLRYSDDHLNRYTLNGKVNVKISDKVTFGYKNRFLREEYEMASQQDGWLFYHQIARQWPTDPVKNPDGHYSEDAEINELLDGGRTEDIDDTYFIQGTLTINPIEQWSIIAEGNYKIKNNNYHQDILPVYAYDVEGNPYPRPVGFNAAGISKVYEYNQKRNFANTNIYSNYEFEFDNSHQLKLMGGFNADLERYRTIGASRTGLITPNLPTINTATDNSEATEGQYQHWATAGFFGRLNYNFNNRYFLEANARYDGSSRFINDKRWNLFPSVSVGWDIAAEPFWPQKDFINQFKIRGSYGELGNQDTQNWYPFYLSMPIGVNSGSWLVNGEQPNTASAPGLLSSQLTWERVSSWNIGVDMAMFNDKLNVTFDYFNRTTYDMIGPAPELPAILGTAVPQINNADMESYGFELQVNWRDQIGDFDYNVQAVLADDRQEITRYPNPTGNIGTWYEGRMIGEIWGYKTAGLAKSQEEMDSHLQNVDQSTLGSNWTAGDIMYRDSNEDGEINGGNGVLGDTGDRSIIGSSHPRYKFSLDITGNYKNFDFRVFLQGIGKRDYMPGGVHFWGAHRGLKQAAGFENHMDFFRNENSPMVQAGAADVNLDAYFPKPYFNNGKNKQTQTRYLQDASYIRLKNLQVGYSITDKIMSAIGARSLRVYVSGENLLTFTSLIDIFDPEDLALSGYADGKTYKLSKMYSVGLDIRF